MFFRWLVPSYAQHSVRCNGSPSIILCHNTPVVSIIMYLVISLFPPACWLVCLHSFLYFPCDEVEAQVSGAPRKGMVPSREETQHLAQQPKDCVPKCAEVAGDEGPF